MRLQYRHIKHANDALDPTFIAPFIQQFGLSAFLETGTYRGDTLASMRSLFDTLISVELSSDLAALAAQRFADDPAVEILQDDSARGLRDAFQRLGNRPAFVWLDAHYSGVGTAKADLNTPILAEVDHILAEREGRDVLLIDDARLFWPLTDGFVTHDTLTGYPLLTDVAQRLTKSRHKYEVFCFCDALLAVPRGVEASPVLAACTQSRLLRPGTPQPEEIECVIGEASGSEGECLSNLPAWLETQRTYGLGGHYFLWRGLRRQRVGHADANSDLIFAKRCGLTTERV